MVFDWVTVKLVFGTVNKFITSDWDKVVLFLSPPVLPVLVLVTLPLGPDAPVRPDFKSSHCLAILTFVTYSWCALVNHTSPTEMSVSVANVAARASWAVPSSSNACAAKTKSASTTSGDLFTAMWRSRVLNWTVTAAFFWPLAILSCSPPMMMMANDDECTAVDVVDVKTSDSTLDDEFIEAHSNDACCTEGKDD